MPVNTSVISTAVQVIQTGVPAAANESGGHAFLVPGAQSGRLILSIFKFRNHSRLAEKRRLVDLRIEDLRFEIRDLK